VRNPHTIKAVRIAYSRTGARCGERHQRARYPDAVVREVLIDYQQHAMYPVEIARARGIGYWTVIAWIYGRRRNVPVDHYTTIPDPVPAPPVSPLSRKPANERGYRGDLDDRGQQNRESEE